MWNAVADAVSLLSREIDKLQFVRRLNFCWSDFNVLVQRDYLNENWTWICEWNADFLLEGVIQVLLPEFGNFHKNEGLCKR